MHRSTQPLFLAVIAALFLLPVSANAAFKDLTPDSATAAAADYLVSKGIVQDAEKFNPDQKLTRAQAAKILVAPLESPEDLAMITSSQFSDVPAGQWFTSYVEGARILGLVDTAPTFNPNGSVSKAAFIKMLLKSKKLDYNEAFSDFKNPISVDLTNTTEWFYPVMRYALASSMIAVSAEGTLGPSHEITRGQMALLYYRLDMYKAGRRTQALLSQAETEIGNVLQMLEVQEIGQAEWAASRSVLAARGALASKPTEPLVKGAVKVSEGFQLLVKAYRAGLEGRLDEAITIAKEAYAQADKAEQFSPSLASLAERMQAIAKNIADQARALKAQPAQ